MEIEMSIIEKILKDTYLEIGKKSNLISELHSDGDRVAVVCSEFRETVLDKLHKAVQ